QAFVGKLITITAKRAAGGGKRGGRAVVQGRGVGRKRPPVIWKAAPVAPDLIGPQFGIMNAVVGFGRTVSEVRVLPKIRFNNARNRVANLSMLSDQGKGAVLDLLEYVGHAIGS